MTPYQCLELPRRTLPPDVGTVPKCDISVAAPCPGLPKAFAYG